MPQQELATAQILRNLNIEALNEMQETAISASGTHDNILLLSNTGSGKTLAFLMSALQHLDNEITTTQVLIVVPSRELALQIESVFRQMGTGRKITCCYGGHKREIEENNLIEAPAVIVGTPGRLCDHIRRGSITTDTIHTLALDEFDKSLEFGFQEEVGFIIEELATLKKRILTSATEAVDIPDFVSFDDYEKLNFLVAEEDDTKLLDIKLVKSPDKDKSETLFKLMCKIGGRSSIIFCNHRETVEDVCKMLKDKGIMSVYYHGAMEQRERDSALCKFRNGTSNILVTTDLAARGLDIPNIRYIVHYHLPQSEDIFTHRNGRTARMEASGTVILMLSPTEYLPEYINKDTEEMQVPDNPELPEKPKWTTIFVSAGKKDKVNKIDLVGFFSKQGQLKKEDIGLIEVKDFMSFVAVRRSKAGYTLSLVQDQKIKKKKVKIYVAK